MKLNDRKAEIKSSIHCIEDLLRFMYNHNVGLCGEYTDHEARDAVKEYVEEVLHINLDDEYHPTREYRENCAVIEELVIDREIDVMIKTCILHEAHREKIIEMVCEEFLQISKEQIIKRVSEIWNKQNP